MEQNVSIVRSRFDTKRKLHATAIALLKCAKQFSRETALADGERAALIAFDGAVFLANQFPEDAARLAAELHAIGIPEDRERVLAACQGMAESPWTAESAHGVIRCWAELNRQPSDDSPPLGGWLPPVFYAMRAGITATVAIPAIGERIKTDWNRLTSESRYLSARLTNWSDNDWAPFDDPFLEYASAFYRAAPHEQRIMIASMREVLTFALTLADPWTVSLWSQTGWHAGRKVGEEMEEVTKDLLGELPPDTLADYLDLYRTTVLSTAAPDGTIRIERATLHYFGRAYRDIHARIYCRGDQPRYVARSAYDFAFWMGLLSTQPIPAKAA